MDTNEIMKKAMIDLLNIGKVIYYNEDDDIDEMIVSFANGYGLLGFMNTLPINNLYVSDDKVILKEKNFEIEKPISIDEYFLKFFPKLDKETINSRIKEYRENYLYNEISSHLRYSEFDKLTILSKDYCEPIDLIKDYINLFIENEKIIISNAVFMTIGSEIIVAIDYFRHVTKELITNKKKIKYQFKSDDDLKKVLFDTTYYLEHKTVPLSESLLK